MSAKLTKGDGCVTLSRSDEGVPVCGAKMSRRDKRVPVRGTKGGYPQGRQRGHKCLRSRPPKCIAPERVGEPLRGLPCKHKDKLHPTESPMNHPYAYSIYIYFPLRQSGGIFVKFTNRLQRNSALCTLHSAFK